MSPYSEVREVAEHQKMNWWGSHPVYTRSIWKWEVENDDTQLGYWEWVEHKIEMKS